MGILVMLLLVSAEIALAVMTFTKWGEKKAWLKNRAVVRLMETALVAGIIALPATHLKWRFTAAAIVLALRFAVAGIAWLAGRKKAEGLRSKPRTVLNCVFSVLLIIFSLVPSLVFSNYNGLPNTGEYDVADTSAILTDSSRIDPFETDGSFREVPAHFYYPVCDGGSFPLIVFSHGAFGYYQSNFSTYTELASHGYVVIALDHPHHSFFTKDTDGNTIIVDRQFISDVMGVNEEGVTNEQIYELSRDWLELRVDDENFVLDTVGAAKKTGSLDGAWFTDDAETILNILAMTDTDNTGLIGHSLGGASSVAVGRQRNDVKAVIDLDGTMLGEMTGVENGVYLYDDTPYPIPVLDFCKEIDYNEREQFKKEYGIPDVNEYVIGNAADGRNIMFRGTGHMDFTDLPLISPFLASMLGHGEADSEQFMPMMNGIVLDWFDHYLKGEEMPELQAQY